MFDLTEPDYALEVCDELTALWDASPDRPVILNLPATVEVATPNVYADRSSTCTETSPAGTR
ncbi:hypothetical protein GCM10009733_076240 [Nonomuraea maheshkhaliensis]|uniref:Uncharacterized protein n=1 Tax=Nonomuraea maheshkhaliensis TaxID=419590 RepID=A0ABN2G9L2_9ACTN